jgi:RNA recognition motif-containing protein
MRLQIEEAKQAAMREQEEIDRDMRTIFVANLALKADDREATPPTGSRSTATHPRPHTCRRAQHFESRAQVYEFFSKSGKVRDVRLIKDAKTRRSKGIG